MSLILTWILGGGWKWLLGGLVAAGIAIWAGLWLHHYHDLEAQAARVPGLEARITADRSAAKAQAKIDTQNHDASEKAAQAQQKIVVQTRTITERIPVYVHDTISCPGLTVGLARVLRAAADGTDPADLPLASGQSDDDCSDVTSSEVAGWFTSYAEAARGNTQQLSDLIASVKANEAVKEQ